MALSLPYETAQSDTLFLGNICFAALPQPQQPSIAKFREVLNVNQSMGDLTQYFGPLEAAVRTASPQAQAKVEELKAETAKGDKADDGKMAGLVEDLATLVPGAVEALVGLFAPAALGKLAGGATKYVLGKLRR